MKKRNISIFLLSMTFSATALASGFKIGAESVSEMGIQTAGAAAAGLDATGHFYNPALIMRFDNPELALPVPLITSNTRFHGATSAPGTGIPFFIPAGPAHELGRADTPAKGLIPSFHYVKPLSPRTGVGISITSPFGLGLKYGRNAILRYDTRKAAAATFNIAPSAAIRLNDQWSFGVGPDFQFFDALFETSVRTQDLTFHDSFSRQKANGWGYGWHAGTLLELNEHQTLFGKRTRFGIGYHSRINQRLKGTSRLHFAEGPLGPDVVFNSRKLEIDLSLPATTFFSVYHDFNDTWALLATADYSQWHVFKTNVTKNIASPTGTLPRLESPQNFHNTWHYALGAHYRVNAQWLLKTGISTDQTPTSNTYRSVIIPNADNVAVSLGFRYQQNKQLSWDFGASQAIIDKVKIRHIEPSSGVAASGNSKTTGNGIGVQLNWKFA